MTDELALPLPQDVLVALAERVAAILRTQEAPRDEWLTSKETAEYLRCGVGRLHNLTSADAIPHHKEGGRLLFRRSELDEWIASGRAAA